MKTDPRDYKDLCAQFCDCCGSQVKTTLKVRLESIDTEWREHWCLQCVQDNQMEKLDGSTSTAKA